MVTHHEHDVAALGMHLQLHLGVRRGVAQGVVEQIAQGGDCQHRRHMQTGVREVIGQLQMHTVSRAAGRVVDGQTRHLFSRTLYAVIKRQAAFNPRQQQ